MLASVHEQDEHVVQRLSRIERTVETIQNALMEAAEMGESRHEDVVRQLHDIADEVGRNQKILGYGTAGVVCAGRTGFRDLGGGGMRVVVFCAELHENKFIFVKKRSK